MDLKINFENISFEGKGKVLVEYYKGLTMGDEIASRIKKIIIDNGNDEIPDDFSADFIIQRGGEIFGQLKAKVVNFIGGINSGIETESLNVCDAELRGDNFVKDSAEFFGKSTLEGNLNVGKNLQINGGGVLLKGSKTNVGGDTLVLDNAEIQGFLKTKTLNTAGNPVFSETSETITESAKFKHKTFLNGIFKGKVEKMGSHVKIGKQAKFDEVARKTLPTTRISKYKHYDFLKV